MNDMLIRNIEPELKRRLEESAHAHNRSLSEEAKAVLRKSLSLPETASSEFGLASRIRASLPPEGLGELEVPLRDQNERKPPDFR